jgi:hypothetical protein
MQWQLNNLIRELRFVLLDVNQNQLKLIIFIDAAFANTLDLHNQIDYVICLIDDVHINLIHWSSIKCKRVIRSVLAAELYAMINDFDVEAIIKSIIERITAYLSIVDSFHRLQISIWLFSQARHDKRKAINDRFNVLATVLREKRNCKD